MGPSATVDLFNKIISNTPAISDQDHLHIIIKNNPKIPPRISDLNPGSESPLPELIKGAQILQKAGADSIIMPCNTAHIWYQEIRDSITIPFYNMITNAVDHTLNQINGSNPTVLLLVTHTTIHTRLYQKAFQETAVTLIIPSLTEQITVNEAIRSVKAGLIKTNPYLEALNKMLDDYANKGVMHILGGCSELPLLFPFLNEDINKLDPTFMLTQFAVSKGL
jgi:aspartate racemase